MEPDENGYRFSKNRTKLKIQKPKGLHGSVFKKTDFGGLGMFFTLPHSRFILQHDRINNQSIFLHAVCLHF